MNRLLWCALTAVTLLAVGCQRPKHSGGQVDPEACAPNPEWCDGLDNDCDGEIDEDFDFTAIETCGTCENDCRLAIPNAASGALTCTPSNEAGVAGTCSFTACAANAFDLDPAAPGCEYRCVKTAEDDVTCNGRDDDCDGVKDEDVDLCSTATCGTCGRSCFAARATAFCESPGETCVPAEARCSISACEAGFVDLDGVYATGCEYECTATGAEVCGDGVDNDCDGLIDDEDDLSGDPAIGQSCFGGLQGACAAPAHAGTTACVGGSVTCTGPAVLRPGDSQEVCDGVDNDCDGVVDEQAVDVGVACGASNTAPCRFGITVCEGGVKTCSGSVEPKAELCNAIDDDCDGQVDDATVDASGICDERPAPPPGATSACRSGMQTCVGGQIQCSGSVGPTTTQDTCGVDANCDGALTNQPDLQSDLDHCGSCGNACGNQANRANWSCQAGTCTFAGCPAGYYDLDGDNVCEYACTFLSAQEACNGVDDDCDGQIDEAVAGTPTPSQVCGVSPNATAAECTTGVTVACVSGAWSCTFPAGVCGPTCAAAAEVCDALDNDCDGAVNENVANYGRPCASDDTNPVPGHGACRTTGTYECAGPNAVVCSATKADCASLPGGCTEICDGLDNDCDGSVDEGFTAKGANATYFVKPEVLKVGAAAWVFTHEASRPNATATSPGTGNGWRCTGGNATSNCPAAPAGEPLDETLACSAQSRQPWVNVSGPEARNACSAIGGRLCSTAEWQTACRANATCTYGYAPRGAACTSAATANKYCNLAVTYDADPNKAGVQSVALATGSTQLSNCWADWAGLQSNPTGANRLYDATGNVRELTAFSASAYALLGGSFLSEHEASAACSYDGYRVDSNFKLFDVGFRCCFDADPRL